MSWLNIDGLVEMSLRRKRKSLNSPTVALTGSEGNEIVYEALDPLGGTAICGNFRDENLVTFSIWWNFMIAHDIFDEALIRVRVGTSHRIYSLFDGKENIFRVSGEEE